MRKSRFTETQIVKILKEVEGGRQVKEVCREYGVSDATYYNWKSKYGGMESSDIEVIPKFSAMTPMRFPVTLRVRRSPHEEALHRRADYWRDQTA